MRKHAVGRWSWSVLGGLVVATGLVLVAPASPAGAIGPVITKVAGTTTAGLGDPAPGNVATRAQFGETWAIGTADGSYWVAEPTRCQVRKVDAAGFVAITIGVKGQCSYSGDGGPGAAAKLRTPSAVALSGTTLYIADTGNCVVRAVDLASADHTISRVAGLAPAGATPQCGNGGDGPPLATGLGQPKGLAVDSSGGLYVADTTNCRIRRIPTTGDQRVVAGGTLTSGLPACGLDGDGGDARSALARLNQPSGLAVDVYGRLVFADTLNHRIRRIEANGTLSTVAGTVASPATGPTGDGAQATAATLSAPQGVATDDGGNVFIADTGNCRVRMVLPTGVISSVAGSKVGSQVCGTSTANRVVPTATQLGQIRNVAVAPGGELVVSNSTLGQVHVVNDVAAGSATVAGQHSRLTQDWRAYGGSNLASRNWSGGDGTYAFPVPGTTKVIWVFSDSFLGSSGGAGVVGADNARADQGFVNNQVVVEDRSATPVSYTNWFRSGNPALNYFPAPAHPEPPKSYVYWPAGGYVSEASPGAGNQLHLFLRLAEGLSIKGVGYSSVAVSDLTSPTAPVAVAAAFPEAVNTEDVAVDLDGAGPAEPTTYTVPCNRVAYGEWVLDDPADPTNVYAYGIESCGVAKFVHVARVPRATPTSGWQYWTGTAWTSDVAQANLKAGRLTWTDGSPIRDFGEEGSITRSGSSYLMTYTQMGSFQDVKLGTSTSPTGPFTGSSSPETFTATDLPFDDPTLSGVLPLLPAFTTGEELFKMSDHRTPVTNPGPITLPCWANGYNAKEQPHAAGPNEMVVSYNLGVGPATLGGSGCEDENFPEGSIQRAFRKLWVNVENYRPRYVRVPRNSAPAAPTITTGSLVVGRGEVTLSWTPPATTGGATIASYTVTATRVSGTAAAPVTMTFPASEALSQRQTVTGLGTGTRYQLTVKATNAGGKTGPASAPVDAGSTSVACRPYATCAAAVADVYADALGRPPTTTESSTAQSALNSGSKSLGTVMEEIRQLDEYDVLVDPITRLYHAYYLRLPDRSGLDYWVGQRNAGKTLSQISQLFSGTPEFKAIYGAAPTPETFVTAIYRNVLGREPDADGLTYWSEELASGRRNRGNVMLAFTESAEGKERLSATTTVVGHWYAYLASSTVDAGTAALIPRLRFGSKAVPASYAASDVARDIIRTTQFATDQGL